MISQIYWNQKKLYIAGLRALTTVNLTLGIDFSELYLDSIKDERAMHSLITSYQRCGAIKKPYNLLAEFSDSEWKTKNTNKLKNELN